jgi:Ti-type conjugative transfer relaxase TraA
MAAYRLAAQVISRSKGGSAVAAAAYRAGVRLYDERTGTEYDYTGRSGVEHREIVLPEGAPEAFGDRGALWNAAERAERRKDAQVARELQLNVPCELNKSERETLVRAFLLRRVSEGMIADYAIHRPSRNGDPRNFHCHALLTLRSVSPDGFGGKVREWNEVAALERWREEWALDCNHALELAGLSTRVTHLSYAARGLDREPSIKLGPVASELERRGVATYAGEQLRAIWERNAARELRRAFEVVRDKFGIAALFAPTELPHNPGVFLAAGEREKRAARDRLLQASYGITGAEMGLGQGWKVARRFLGGVEFRAGDRMVSDRGDKVFGKTGDADEIAALLAVAEAKGWRTLTFDGTDAFKTQAYKAAIERGFRINAAGRDKMLLERAERAARRSLSERDRWQSAAPAGTGAPAQEAEQAAPAPRDPALVVERVLAEMTHGEARFTQRDLDRALSRYAKEHAEIPLDDLLQAARVHPSIVQVGSRFGVSYYTTETVREQEREMFDAIAALAQDHAYPTDRAYMEQVAAEMTISGGQLDALRRITGPERASAVIGFAGTGKSYMMKAARLVWERAGYNVVGVALAGVAAQGLEEGSGIPSSTIASFLLKHEAEPGREPKEPLPENTIIAIDEAGMVGSDDYRRLVRIAEHYNAKLVSIGDYEQLQAIERGAAFRGIVERLGAAEITEIQRQKKGAAWMCDATKEMATEKTKDALKRYDEAGLSHESPTLDDAKKHLVEKWVADHKAYPTQRNEKGDLVGTQIILAFTNKDVESLNLACREERKKAGELGEDVDVALAIPRGQNAVSHRTQLAAGDRVYFLANNKDLNGVAVMNGSLGTVEAVVAGEDPQLTVALDNQKTVAFKLSEYKTLTHGYAATVNKAQGVTVDRAYALATSHWNRHLTYVAMSRHRYEAHLYWSTDVFRNAAQRDRVLSRKGLKENALDHEIERPIDRAPTYIRTLRQVQGEFDRVLSTAHHLAAVASEQEHEAAQVALAETQAWHRDMSMALERLREADVPIIEIDRHDHDNLAEHVEKLQAGVEREIERTIERKQAELEQRVEEGRSEAIDESAQAIEAERTDADLRARGISSPEAAPAAPEIAAEPERAPSPAEPIRDVNLRTLHPILADRIVARATEMLQSESYLQRTVAIAALTGRRPVEILKTGEFQVGFGPNEIIFSGQAKTRDETGRARDGYEIPALADRDAILEAVANLRAELSVPTKRAETPLSELDASELNDRVGKSLRQIAQREFGMTPQEIRAAYATIAHARFAPERGTFAYFAQVLGHNALDDKTGLSYAKYAVRGKEQVTLRGMERGRSEMLDALRQQLLEHDATTREQDPMRGYLQERIARMEAARFVAPVEPADIGLRPVNEFATLVRAERLLRSERYADVATGLAILTGRSVTEILRDGRFDVDPADKNRILVRNGPKGPQESVYVLAPPQRIVGALAKIREQRDFVGLTDRELLTRVREQMQAAIVRGFGENMTSRDLRAIYATVAYERERPNIGFAQYASRVLGVDPDRVAEGYTRFYVGNADRAMERVRRGLADARTELQRLAAQERDSALRDKLLQRAERLAEPNVHVEQPYSIELDVQELRDTIRRERMEVERELAQEHGDDDTQKRRRTQQQQALQQDEIEYEEAEQHELVAEHEREAARGRHAAGDALRRAELLGRREELLEIESDLEATVERSPDARVTGHIGRDSMIDLDAVRGAVRDIDQELYTAPDIAAGAELGL